MYGPLYPKLKEIKKMIDSNTRDEDDPEELVKSVFITCWGMISAESEQGECTPLIAKIKKSL